MSRGERSPLAARAAALTSIDIFAGCGPREIERLSSLSEEVVVRAGAVVVREGTRGSAFFFVVDGTAEVSVGGEWVADLGPGDFFGEMALLGAAARTATVTAASPLRLLVIEAPGFAAFMREAPSAAFMLSRAAVERQGRQRSVAVQGAA